MSLEKTKYFDPDTGESRVIPKEEGAMMDLNKTEIDVSALASVEGDSDVRDVDKDGVNSEPENIAVEENTVKIKMIESEEEKAA